MRSSDAATKADLTALRRSFDVYYRDRDRTARMDRLNAQFLKRGGLAFDIGAHVGDRTGSFARLGVRTVSVEPQPHIFRALRLIYSGNGAVMLRRAAVGATRGTIDLYVNSSNPTVTTASADLIKAAQISPDWQDQVWDRRITVPMVTLDDLIADHGVPDFIKIDVEGHEAAVLDGLTQAVPALSFEFTTIQRDVAFACLNRLSQFGTYRFNWSLGEDHALRYDCAVDAERLRADLGALPASANSGDIFATLA